MTRVSAIIPVYNGAATIVEAIDSALAQSYPSLEVIVVNDGSTDATAEVLRRYAERVKVIDQANGGIAAARNAGVAMANSEYLAFLDADDIWTPAMIERTVTALDGSPDCVLAFTNCAVIDSDGRDLDSALIGAGVDHAPTLGEMLSQLWPIMPSAVVMRRVAFEVCGGFSRNFAPTDSKTWFSGCAHANKAPFVICPNAW